MPKMFHYESKPLKKLTYKGTAKEMAATLTI